MPITEHQKQELLLFNDGKPLIVTAQDLSDNNNEFSLTVYIRTISSPTPEFIKAVSLLVFFSADFPKEEPNVRLFRCQLFHPNFTDTGEWLGSTMCENESLSEYLMRLVRVLQYKNIDTECVGKRNAMAWYNKNKEKGLLPTDIINYSVKPIKPQITILRLNDNS